MSAELVLETLAGRLSAMARKAARTYHANYLEMESEAQFLAYEAYRRHTPERGPMENWVTFFVHRRLRSVVREEFRQRARYEVLKNAHLARKGMARFDVGEEPLSPDAREVVRMALDDRRGYASQVRGRIKRELRERGWGPRRIIQTLAELKGFFS
jgi:hypothetical protein